jgi:hypothetical protein
VAILTTPAFDALAVEVSTLALGDPSLTGRVTPLGSRAKDVDRDGDVDLLLFFSRCDLVTNGAVEAHSTALVLTGETVDGTSITGSDSVRTKTKRTKKTQKRTTDGRHQRQQAA